MAINKKFEFLFEVANKTKNALLKERSDAKFFTDKNYLNCKYREHFSGAQLSEGIGLTGMLLFLTAFRNEPEVISEEDKAAIGASVIESFEKLYEFSANGFLASPLLKDADSLKIFTESEGYTETITWCLSSSILMRYADKNGAISLDADMKAKVLDLMARALGQLLGGQRKDGSWGFRAEPCAARSLYFTYSVSATLADFFDYILGEIAKDVEKSDEGSAIDTETLDYLDSRLGFNTKERVEAAREALQNWILRSCIPLLPKLAECSAMSAKEKELLGMWDTKGVAIKGEDGTDVKKHLHNLYYTYYLIDMTVTSATDLRYAELCTNADELSDLAKYYSDNSLIDENSINYYFRDGKEENFITDYIDDAIAAAKIYYAKAAATGDAFWDISKSELTLNWIHEDEDVTDTASEIIEYAKPSKPTLSDPSIKPMALRANINYNYYVAQAEDGYIDKLFVDICDDVCRNYDESDDMQRKNLVLNLWDNLYYSLPVTERAIESFIDYYDYLNMLEDIKNKKDAVKVEKVVETVTVVETVEKKSEFELALEAKIADYLKSDAGKAIIRDAIGDAIPEKKESASPALSIEALTEEIENLRESIHRASMLKPKGNEKEKLIAALARLIGDINDLNTKVKIRELESKNSDTSIDYVESLNAKLDKHKDLGDELFTRLIADQVNGECNYAALYARLKEKLEIAD